MAPFHYVGGQGAYRARNRELGQREIVIIVK